MNTSISRLQEKLLSYLVSLVVEYAYDGPVLLHVVVGYTRGLWPTRMCSNFQWNLSTLYTTLVCSDMAQWSSCQQVLENSNHNHTARCWAQCVNTCFFVNVSLCPPVQMQVWHAWERSSGQLDSGVCQG